MYKKVGIFSLLEYLHKMENEQFISEKNGKERYNEYRRWKYASNYNGYKDNQILKSKIYVERNQWIKTLTTKQLLKLVGWNN